LGRIAQGLAPLLVALTVAAGFAVVPPLAWVKTLRIVVENVGFGLTPQDARVSDMVDWVDKDFVAHTAPGRDGSFDLVLTDRPARPFCWILGVSSQLHSAPVFGTVRKLPTRQ
jgi:hypothetical protein